MTLIILTTIAKLFSSNFFFLGGGGGGLGYGSLNDYVRSAICIFFPVITLIIECSKFKGF